MAGYSIGEFARKAGVTRRTIRYYVELGLLPPPESSGRGAAYSPEHLERLETIKHLQEARLSLDEIRDQLAVNASPDATPEAARGSAAQYLASLSGIVSDPHTLPPEPVRRSQSHVGEPWVRYSLSADVELHIRRRGARTDPRIERLIKEARSILAEGEPQ